MTNILTLKPYIPHVAEMQFAQFNALVAGAESHLREMPQREFEAEYLAAKMQLQNDQFSLGGHFLVHLYVNEDCRREGRKSA